MWWRIAVRESLLTNGRLRESWPQGGRAAAAGKGRGGARKLLSAHGPDGGGAESHCVQREQGRLDGRLVLKGVACRRLVAKQCVRGRSGKRMTDADGAGLGVW